MARTRVPRTIASSRLLPALASALIACSSSGGSRSPSGTTAPTIANLSYYPQSAGTGEGGGMVGITFHVDVSDPDADVARLVATAVDATGAQVSQLSGAVQNPSGATSGMLEGTADIPTTAVASYTIQVQVFDSGDRGSNVLQGSFSVVPGNTLPEIATLTPESVTAGSPGFMLTLTGAGFLPASVVYWNGTSLGTTYVDATTLQAYVDSYRVYTTGTAQVTVVNPPPGGGTSPAVTFLVEPPAPNPVPAVATLSPASADAGGPQLTLTVTGTGFVRSSQVLWNATSSSGAWDLSTTFVDSTTLKAQVPSSLTSWPGTASVTVQNPAPGGGTAAALTFTITRPVQPGVRLVSLEANDLVWDPYHRKIYLAVPGLSAVNPNTVTVLDPFTGELGASVYVGSEPSRLSLSDDGQLLYVALRGASSVERLTVPDLVRDLTIALGRDPTYGAYYALDLQVAPGSPATIAVSLLTMDSLPHSGGVVVYDDQTARPTRAASSFYGYDSLQWGTTASELYAVASGYGYDLYAFGVDASGVVIGNTYHSAFSNPVLVRFDAGNGLLYGDDGRVIDPATGSLVGTYPSGSAYYNPRRVVPDSSLGAVWFARGESYPTTQVTVGAYDLAQFFPTTSTTVRFVAGAPRRPIRWGQDGLAFVATGSVVLLDGPLVLPVATTPNPVPAVTSLSPSSAAAGGPNLVVVVNGTDFVRGSVVSWNGSERTTRFVSPTVLVAYVPASDLAAAGSASLTVASPSPGGGTSGAATFTVSP